MDIGGVETIKKDDKYLIIVAFSNKVYAFDYDAQESWLIYDSLLPIRRIKCCDVDNDGTLELIIVDDVSLVILDIDTREEIARFNVKYAPPANIVCSDIDGDGLVEIIVPGLERKLHIFTIEGIKATIELNKRYYPRLKSESEIPFIAYVVFPVGTIDLDGDSMDELIFEPVILVRAILADSISTGLWYLDYDKREGKYRIKSLFGAGLKACYGSAIVRIKNKPYIFLGLEKAYGVAIKLENKEPEIVEIDLPHDILDMKLFDIDKDGKDELIVAGAGINIIVFKIDTWQRIDLNVPFYETWYIAPFFDKNGKPKIVAQGPYLDYIAIIDVEKDIITESQIELGEKHEVETISYDKIMAMSKALEQLRDLISKEDIAEEELAREIIFHTDQLDTNTAKDLAMRFVKALKEKYNEDVYLVLNKVLLKLGLEEKFKPIISEWFRVILKNFVEGNMSPYALSLGLKNLHIMAEAAINWRFHPTGDDYTKFKQILEEYPRFLKDVFDRIEFLGEIIKEYYDKVEDLNKAYILLALALSTGLGPAVLKDVYFLLSDEKLSADKRIKLLTLTFASASLANEVFEDYPKILDALVRQKDNIQYSLIMSLLTLLSIIPETGRRLYMKKSKFLVEKLLVQSYGYIQNSEDEVIDTSSRMAGFWAFKILEIYKRCNFLGMFETRVNDDEFEFWVDCDPLIPPLLTLILSKTAGIRINKKLVDDLLDLYRKILRKITDKTLKRLVHEFIVIAERAYYRKNRQV